MVVCVCVCVCVHENKIKATSKQIMFVLLFLSRCITWQLGEAAFVMQSANYGAIIVLLSINHVQWDNHIKILVPRTAPR